MGGMGGSNFDFGKMDDDEGAEDAEHQEGGFKQEDIKVEPSNFKMERDDSIKFERTETK